jgi:hypothetical protein
MQSRFPLSDGGALLLGVAVSCSDEYSSMLLPEDCTLAARIAFFVRAKPRFPEIS